MGRVVVQAVTTGRNTGWMSGDGAGWTVDMAGSMPVLDHSISLLGLRQGDPSQQLLGSQLSFLRGPLHVQMASPEVLAVSSELIIEMKNSGPELE